MQFGGKGNPMPRGCHEIPEKRGVRKFGGLIKAVWHEKDLTELLILLDLGNDAKINNQGTHVAWEKMKIQITLIVNQQASKFFFFHTDLNKWIQ